MTSLFEAVFLGVLQGVTEFLPISSSGHLALSQMLFSVRDASLTLSVMLHGGTLLATAIVLRRRLAVMLVDSIASFRRPSRLLDTPGGRDLLFVMLASVPTAIIGLSLRDTVEVWTASPTAVGFGFCVTAALLILSRWAPGGVEERPSWRSALLLGVTQGLAVVPGISRSGSTIATALWLGVRPDRAFELSMLMSLPAVLGAVLLELRHALAAPEGGAALLVGTLSAFFVGWVALLLLRYLVARGHFSLFALWVFPLALATLAMGWAWPERLAPPAGEGRAEPHAHVPYGWLELRQRRGPLATGPGLA